MFPLNQWINWWIEKVRKYNIHCNYCGADKPVSWLLLHLRLLFRGTIYDRCDDCGHMSAYILVSHVVHDTCNIKEKDVNRSLMDGLDDVCKRG